MAAGSRIDSDLEVEEAGDDLHVVLDPVMDLAEEDLLLAQRLPELVLGPGPLRRVVDEGDDQVRTADPGGPDADLAGEFLSARLPAGPFDEHEPVAFPAPRGAGPGRTPGRRRRATRRLVR